MENVADALKMAGAVLLFVMAISVAIVSFGQVRQTSDIILNYKDRETEYIDGHYYYDATGTERNVGLETVIPAVYRAYIENYKIVFNGLEKPIYKLKMTDGTSPIDKKTIDLETNKKEDQYPNITEDELKKYQNVSLANNEQKSEFLCGILYGKFKNNDKDAFEKKFNISLDGCEPLYTQLKDRTIKEYLGVYYQNDSEDVPDVNKTEKRVITYEVQ